MSGVEILSLAASVIQIAELGAKLSVSLFTFTRKVKNANKAIDALSQEIAVTGAVLQQLGETLSNDKSVKVCSQEAIDTAKKLVLDTEKVFKNLENLLDVQEKPNSRFRKAVNLKRLKFPFLESEIEQVQANLERLKSSLLVILNVLIFAEQLRNREALPILENQRDLIRTLAAEKDANEQRYENILKAIADRPKSQSSGQSDTSSLHSNTVTLVGDSSSHLSTDQAKQVGQKVDKLPVIDLPDGLKVHYERISHHTHLVQNLLSEIDSLEYKLDHNIRGRMHTGVLQVHWNEWTPQRKLFGTHSFEKILSDSTEIATYWADKTIDEQLKATQAEPASKNSMPGHTKITESGLEIEDTKKYMMQNIEKILQRGERLDTLAAKTDDLAVSAKAFRTKAKTQNNTWYDLLSAPAVWVGSALNAAGSRLWQGDAETSVTGTITFTHEVQEDPTARKKLLTAAIGVKVGNLPEDQIQEFVDLRKETKQPEYTIDECTKQQVHLFKVVFDDFDNGASDKVSLEFLGDMIRRLGYNPDDRALNTWCLEVGLGAEDVLTFEDYIAIMLRATQELKELIMDDPPLDPPATQQNPPLIESGTASQTFESLSADAGDMNDEMRQEFTEVFELFDKDGSGRLRVTDLNTIMRSLGQNPTEMEMTDVMSKADLTEDGQFTVEDFLKIMRTITAQEEHDDPPREAFAVYDRGASGTMTVTELYAVMKTLGEISTEAEMQDLLSRAGLTGQTEVSYDDFIQRLAMTGDESAASSHSIKKHLIGKDVDEIMPEDDNVIEHRLYDDDDLGLDLGDDLDLDLDLGIDGPEFPPRPMASAPRIPRRPVPSFSPGGPFTAAFDHGIRDPTLDDEYHDSHFDERKGEYVKTARKRFLGAPGKAERQSDLSMKKRGGVSPISGDHRRPKEPDAISTSSTAFDEVDVLIMRYTNVDGEELRGLGLGRDKGEE